MTTEIAIEPPVAAWAVKFECSEALDAVTAVAVRMYEANTVLGRFLQIHVIIDTSIVIEDLIALMRTESEKHRRPAIYELVAKKTLIAYFPSEKLAEVDEKITAIAARHGFSHERLAEHWQAYCTHLHLVPALDLERDRPDVETLAARDPSDVAFLQARHIVGASLVLSKDHDIRDSGAPVMPWSRVLVDLRHYSRKNGVHAAVFLGGGTAIIVPLVAIVGCVRLICGAINRVPREALVLAAVGIGIALLVPESRAFLMRAGKAAWEKVKDAAGKVAPFVEEALAAAEQAKAKASELRPKIDEALGSALNGRVTLRQACYRVCLIAQRPLTVQEIWSAASAHGAKSKARNPLQSVLRALKAHKLLRALPDGRWQASPLQSAACAMRAESH